MLRADEQRGQLEEQVRAAVSEFGKSPTQGWPRRAGPYRLTAELGRGGMGTVYLGERDDGQYEAQVAVKVIRRGLDTQFFLTRFKRERQALARLEHPNIARLYDSGTTEDGLPYIVMELVRGEPITVFARNKNLSGARRLRLFLDVCSAVAHAHRRSIVHRDLKPGNILVQEDGTPKLLDFGICKLMEEGVPLGETMTGLRLLTPQYASPEQLRGQTVTAASDVYSLAAVLAELVAGNSDVSGELDRVLRKGQAQEPGERHESVDAFAAELREVLQRIETGKTEASGQRRAWIRRRAMAGAAAAVAVTAFAIWRWADKEPARVDASAMPLYLEAHRVLKVRPQGETPEQALVRSRSAVRLFEQAAKQYPDSAQVQSGLAEAYLAISDWEPPKFYDDMKLARETAERGLALDDRLDTLHHTLGSALLFGSWEPAKALESFNRAVKLNPRNSFAHRLRADIYCMFGRFEEAQKALDAVLAASPLDTEVGAEKAAVYFRWRRIPQAQQAAQQTLAVEPGNFMAKWVLGLTYQYQGRVVEAEKLFRGLPGRPRRYPISLAHLLIMNHRAEEAAPAIAEIEKVHGNPSALALLRAIAGDYEGALKLLEDSLESRDINLMYVPMDPRYDMIRDHPRFVNVFRRIGLPAAP